MSEIKELKQLGLSIQATGAFTGHDRKPSYADFLLEVMKTEADARRSRYLRARLQLAHLPYGKTFEHFDFSFQPSIDERQVRELQTLRFVHEASNAICLGPRSRQNALERLLTRSGRLTAQTVREYLA